MSDLIDRQAAIATAVKAAIDWHRLANPQYSIAYCIGEAMRELPSAQPDLQLTCNQFATDCISRQAAIDVLKAHEDYKGYLHGDFEEILESLPSAQPEIIRCKDCKHQVKEWREDGRFKDNGYWVHGCEIISDVCGYWALFGHNDQFCSEAERRNDG